MPFSIKKYVSDDENSWAVFNSEDVEGLLSPIFWGEAKPLIFGLDRTSALDVVKHLTQCAC